MPLYEHVFLARQDLPGQQAEGMIQEFSKIIEDGGGTVHKTEYWGLRPISYRIKKNRKAHYALMNLDAPIETVAELERQLRLNSDVLRYMTIRVDELEEAPSAMMRRSDRDDRDGRGGRGDRGDRGDRRPPRDRNTTNADNASTNADNASASAETGDEADKKDAADKNEKESAE